MAFQDPPLSARQIPSIYLQRQLWIRTSQPMRRIYGRPATDSIAQIVEKTGLRVVLALDLPHHGRR